MDRSTFYREALKNLGISGTIRRALSKKAGAGPIKLTSRYAAHPVYARRGSSDLQVFDQIFVERPYSCLDYIQGARSILDLGANCGFSSAYFLSRFPDASVVAVEPDRANFDALVANTRPFTPRITCLEGAVWSECTLLSFDEDTMAQGMEWGRQTRDVGKGGGIEAWDIPALMQIGGFSTIDILKIDIEGAEEELFSTADTSWLTLVKAIVIELHGDSCEAAFRRAIEGANYRISRCGELTVCTRSGGV